MNASIFGGVPRKNRDYSMNALISPCFFSMLHFNQRENLKNDSRIAH
jgi:hypothetical protein